MVAFLVSIMIGLVTQTAVAGGGGCGGECPPPKPKDPQAECVLDEIRAVDPSTFELDQSVEKMFTTMKAGFSAGLRGDSQDLYSAEISYANVKWPQAWDAWHGKYVFDRSAPSANATFYYRTRWSISGTDPRPLVEMFKLQLVQEPEAQFARFRLIASGRFDQADPWRTSDRTVFVGTMRCKF